MKYEITLGELWDLEPCKERYRHLLNGLKTKFGEIPEDDVPISYMTILEICGWKDLDWLDDTRSGWANCTELYERTRKLANDLPPLTMALTTKELNEIWTRALRELEEENDSKV